MAAAAAAAAKAAAPLPVQKRAVMSMGSDSGWDLLYRADAGVLPERSGVTGSCSSGLPGGCGSAVVPPMLLPPLGWRYQGSGTGVAGWIPTTVSSSCEEMAGRVKGDVPEAGGSCLFEFLLLEISWDAGD